MRRNNMLLLVIGATAVLCVSANNETMPRFTPIWKFFPIGKSFESDDPVLSYCVNVSLKQDPLQRAIMKKTIEESEWAIMLGAPEVLQLGQNLIRLTKAKRALDIGTYTGASAVAWALAVPDGGEVLSMDISHDNLNNISREMINARPEIAKKINFKLGPANETLDELIAAGENSTWDFAFIDADKENYPEYYEKCVQLLRPGGVILIDNALFHGTVVNDPKENPAVEAIDKTNWLASKDTRVDNMLLNLGDGTHVIFKKFE